MTGLLSAVLVPAELVVALLVVVAAAALHRARRRRVRDLALLAAVGTALGPPGAAGADRPEPWCDALPVLRAHLRAARVAVVGRAVGTPDLAAHLPASDAGAVWTRRSAPAAVGEALARRGVDEIVVVPLRSRSGPLGTLEVHDPARPWWARWGGSLRGELALLSTVAGQIAAVVEATRVSDQLRRDVRHDPLTGLLNRTGFLEVAGAGSRGGRTGGVAVVAFSLLDQVTESVGHARGERFVALAAERLAAACAQPWFPGSPVVARLEGDTFALVVPEGDPEAAHRLADRVREQLVAPCLLEELPFEAPVHVGVALDAPSLVRETGPPPAGSEGSDGLLEAPDAPWVAALLRRADVALAAARRGGPPVRCYEPSMGEQAARRLAVVRGFPEAVATGQVRVHYQPTVALRGQGAPATGAVLGVEALARWRHPELGELLPDEFVPVLEATGQITELTRFVLDEALAAARGWLDAGLRLSVAVNVPVGNLADPAFPDEVAARLARHGVPAELLTLELTESGVSAEREAALPVLRRLHVLGARLAVDDFGTGQSSLAHLRRLPVDQVKIDKSFVMGMDTELGDMAVVRAIVEMGHTLGLTVVAEGVEQVAVRAALVEMGCDVAQGYLVSRPLSAGRLERWLATLAAVPVTPGGEGGPLTLIA